MVRAAVIAVLVAISTVAWAVQPDAPFKPGRLPKEELATLQPGLTLRFLHDGKTIDARRIRLAALHVPAGTAPSPFVAPGSFHARLIGYIKAPLRGEYGFRLTTTGKTTLSINGKEVLTTAATTGKDTAELIELAKGYNRLDVDFTNPAQDDATLRVSWFGEGFAAEPIPTDVIFTRGNEADLVAGTLVREGRMLFGTLGCAHCHAGSSVKDGGMPELAHQAPSLENAGERFNTDWLARWIADPRSLRPEATMPQVLHGDGAAQKAADLAAYLSTLKASRLVPGLKGDAGEGEKIFARLGCVTCHHLQEPGHADELKRLALFHVAAKFRDGALDAFLRKPHQHYAWIRMPDFKLSDKEAGDLTAYLSSAAKGTVDASPQQAGASAACGAKLFADGGCAQCHRTETKAELPAPKLPVITTTDKGCLAAEPGKAPRFALSAEQKRALAAFLKTDRASLTRETAAEFSERQMQALQCTSCHRRDGGTTHWHQVLEEEGKMPEYLPSLTWTGEKLHPAWTARLLLGQSPQRARPWLKARMPAFPARAELLALGLSHEHGYGAKEDERPAPNHALAEIGAKLIPQQGGLNCIMCHGVGKKPAVEPFEAPGINLLDAALRLRHDYYLRWMRNPARVDVTTRMPVFAPDGKTTAIREILDGDATRQFDALWHFIQELPALEKK